MDVDDTPPVIVLLGDSNVTHEAGGAYGDDGASWNDNVDGDGNVTGVGEVDATLPGTYTLTYDYTDNAGNAAAQVTRTVTVEDTTAPVIVLNGDEVVTHEGGIPTMMIMPLDRYSGRNGYDHREGDVNVMVVPGTYILKF